MKLKPLCQPCAVNFERQQHVRMLQLDTGILASNSSSFGIKANPLHSCVHRHAFSRQRGLCRDVAVAAGHAGSVCCCAAAAAAVQSQPVTRPPGVPASTWGNGLLPYTTKPATRLCLQLAFSVMVHLQVRSLLPGIIGVIVRKRNEMQLCILLTVIISILHCCCYGVNPTNPLFQVLAGNGLAAELLESSLNTEGNVPSELSAAGGQLPQYSSVWLCKA